MTYRSTRKRRRREPARKRARQRRRWSRELDRRRVFLGRLERHMGRAFEREYMRCIVGPGYSLDELDEYAKYPRTLDAVFVEPALEGET